MHIWPKCTHVYPSRTLWMLDINSHRATDAVRASEWGKIVRQNRRQHTFEKADSVKRRKLYNLAVLSRARWFYRWRTEIVVVPLSYIRWSNEHKHYNLFRIKVFRFHRARARTFAFEICVCEFCFSLSCPIFFSLSRNFSFVAHSLLLYPQLCCKMNKHEKTREEQQKSKRTQRKTTESKTIWKKNSPATTHDRPTDRPSERSTSRVTRPYRI